VSIELKNMAAGEHNETISYMVSKEDTWQPLSLLSNGMSH